MKKHVLAEIRLEAGIEGIKHCYTGKPIYDKKGAQTAANLRFKRDHVKLRIYSCRGHWHLTSQI